MRMPAATLALVASICFAQPPARTNDDVMLRRDIARASELTAQESIAKNPALTPQQRIELTDLMVAELGPMIRDGEDTSESGVRTLAAQTRVRFVALGTARETYALLQAWDYRAGCGGTGNCPTFVFRKTRGRWQKLLDGTAQTVAIRARTSDGYKDLLLAMHGSAWESDVRIYRFSGGRYSPGACFNANWQTPNLGFLSKPVITPCGYK